MSWKRSLSRGSIAFALAVFVAAQAGASSFTRVGLDYLVAANETVVVGEVLEKHSYSNESGFILTAAKVGVVEVLKGNPHLREVTVTLPGGSIGEESTVVVGGAELAQGSSYVLFLRRGNLPGARGVLMVRDHSQGVFELEKSKDGPRVISQAKALVLLPDGLGAVQTPGGAAGLSFEDMKQAIRELAARGDSKEVK
jgi:hypothetical protein